MNEEDVRAMLARSPLLAELDPTALMFLVRLGRRRIWKVGEVLMRGPNVMAGYWQDPAATAAALADGWLRTGDIGQFDENGDLSIVGRIKDVIRSGSTSIVPKEVEDTVAQHPAVQEVSVVGMPPMV